MASPAIAAILDLPLRVTIDAPRHPHCRNTGDTVHRLDRTVTFLACEPRLDVPLMCEVNKIGNIVHLDPRYRLAIFPKGCQLQDFRSVADGGDKVVTSHAFADTGDAGNGRLVGIDMTMLARNLVVRRMHRVTEFDWLDRTTVRKIFAVHPCTEEQSDHDHKPKQGWLFRGPERIENRDRQMVPLLLGQEFARKLRKLQIQYMRGTQFRSLRRGGDFGTFRRALNVLTVRQSQL